MDRSGAPSRENSSDEPEATMEERVQVVHSFLEGLLDSFGLDGEVILHHQARGRGDRFGTLYLPEYYS